MCVAVVAVSCFTFMFYYNFIAFYCQVAFVNS